VFELLKLYWWLLLGLAVAVTWTVVQYRRQQRLGLCPNCGTRVPDDKDECPRCNRPFERPSQLSSRAQRRQMRALIVALLLAGYYVVRMYVVDASRVQSDPLEHQLEQSTSLIQRFLAAERSGQYLSSSSRTYGCEGEYPPPEEVIEPAASSRLVISNLRGDTAVFGVEYLLLGVLRGKRFVSDVRYDTVEFRLIPTAAGETETICDPGRPGAYHWGIDAANPRITSLDTRSVKQWQSALSQARNVLEGGAH
jgi:hypothetical protein